MGLKIPQAGDPSPGYVNDIATSLSSLDSHDHSSGNGKQITQAGIGINGALAMNGQTLNSARSVLFSPQAPLSAAADNGSLFVNGVDLYYLDGNNQLVRLTTGGKSAGAIGGDYPNYPLAQVSYSHPDLTYYFRDGSNNFAKINSSSLALGTSSATSYQVLVGDPGSGTGFRFRTNSNTNAKIYTGDIDAGVSTVSGQTISGSTISGGTGTFTGNVAAANYSTTGGVTAVNVAASGSVQAATITATGSPGTVNANNVICTGNAAVGSLNATGGVLQGSRTLAIRGSISSSSLNGSTTSAVQTYLAGGTPGFGQTIFTAPYAGSVAAMTVRIYNSNATAGTLYLTTSGLTPNASTPTGGSAFTFSQVNAGVAYAFAPATFTFTAGTTMFVNAVTSGWTQSTGTIGVEVALYVYL